MIKKSEEVKIDSKQLRGIVSERNIYKKLLDSCLNILNTIPNQKFNNKNVKDTYELASKIEENLKKL